LWGIQRGGDEIYPLSSKPSPSPIQLDETTTKIKIKIKSKTTIILVVIFSLAVRRENNDESSTAYRSCSSLLDMKFKFVVLGGANAGKTVSYVSSSSRFVGLDFYD
jgi:hypothetical protein